MLLQLPVAAVASSRAALPARRAAHAAAPCLRARSAPLRRVVAAAAKKKAPEPEPEAAELSGPAAAVVYAGLVAVPITYWSEYTLFTTGAGLQGDVLGGIEGVSYLVLLAVLAVSVQKKTSTGVGLEGALPGASALPCVVFHALTRAPPRSRRRGGPRVPVRARGHRRRGRQRAEGLRLARSPQRSPSACATTCQRMHTAVA